MEKLAKEHAGHLKIVTKREAQLSSNIAGSVNEEMVGQNAQKYTHVEDFHFRG